MKKLNDIQVEFLLTTFFSISAENCANWRDIAIKLLNDGECIIGGNKRIWSGGVGNFITISNAENAFDCMLHKFSLDEFISSQYYKEVTDIYIVELLCRKLSIENEINNINALSGNHTCSEPKSTCYTCKYMHITDGEPCDSCDDNYRNYHQHEPCGSFGLFGGNVK